MAARPALTLVLLRHADAGDPDPARWPNDDFRPLSAEGREQAAAAGAGLSAAGIAVDHLLASPRTRAWETAVLSASAGGWPEPRTLAELGPAFTPRSLLAALSGLRGCIVCVGHEPDLSLVSSILLGGDPSRDWIRFGKGAALGLDFGSDLAPGKARLSFFLRPSHLGLLAR